MGRSFIGETYRARRPTLRPMLPLTAYLEELHAKFLGDVSGEVASYIPELARVDPDRFGICIVMVDGTSYEVGDTRLRFTIQSMSKPLTYAMALDELGPDVVGRADRSRTHGRCVQRHQPRSDHGPGDQRDGQRRRDHRGRSDPRRPRRRRGQPAARRILQVRRTAVVDRHGCRHIGADHRPPEPGDRPSPARRGLARRRCRILARGVLPAVLGRGRLSRSGRDRGDVGQRRPQPGRRVGGRVATDGPSRRCR